MKLILIILSVLFSAVVSGQKVGPIIDPEFIDTIPDPGPPDTTVIPPGARSNLIFAYYGGDSAGDYDKWHHTAATHCCAYSQVEQTDTAHDGTHALRFILLRGSPDTELSAGSKRSEVDINKVDPPGTERWYGASYYFLSTKYLFDNDPEIWWQEHHQGSTGSPPLAIRTWKGRYYAVTRTVPTGSDVNADLGPIVYNQWVDLVVHYIARDDAGGQIQIWIDGVLVYDYTGPSAFTGQGNYPKTGIYKWDWHSRPAASSTNERVLYMDDFRIGNQNATYADVAP